VTVHADQMNHYHSLGDAPYYDRTQDPHMRGFFRKLGGEARIKLTGDPVTGHLARDEFKRAVRYSPTGLWKNRSRRLRIPPHPKFASTSCNDCDSGGFCRCPIRVSIDDQYSRGPTPYSRDQQPPSPTQRNFMRVSKRIFPKQQGPNLLAPGATAVHAPQLSEAPPLSTAIISAGHAAARRHSARTPMCGGGLITSMVSKRQRPHTVDTGRARGVIGPPSESKRYI
jgi:hypothetical protein